MADKNIVMDRPDMLVALHGWTGAEVAAAGDDGYVGERNEEGVGLVKYYVTVKKTVRMPNQFGDK